MRRFDRFGILFATNRECIGGYETFSVVGKPDSFFVFSTCDPDPFWSDKIEGEPALDLYAKFRDADKDEFIRLCLEVRDNFPS